MSLMEFVISILRRAKSASAWRLLDDPAGQIERSPHPSVTSPIGEGSVNEH